MPPPTTQVPEVRLAPGTQGVPGKLNIRTPVPLSPGAGHVVETWVLKNGTSLPGNFESLTGGDSSWIVYDSLSDSTFVVNELPSTVSAINDKTDSVSAVVRVPNYPMSATFVPETGAVYVTGLEPFGGHGSIDVINGSTDSLTGTIPVSSQWSVFGSAYDPVNGDLYAAEVNQSQERVTIISLPSETTVGNISGVGGPYSTLAYDSSNGELYVMEPALEKVAVVNTELNRVVSNITYPATSSPSFGSIGYDISNNELYVVNFALDQVSAIAGSNNSILTTISLGPYPSVTQNIFAPIAFDSTNGYIYIANGDTGAVSVVNGSTNRLVGSIPTGIGPVAASYDSKNQRIYVANSDSGNVSVWVPASASNVANIELGVDPGSLAVDPTDGVIYSLGSGPDQLMSLNASTAARIHEGELRAADELITWDSANGGLYAIGSSILTDVSTLYSVDPASLSITSSVPLGTLTEGIAVNTSSDELYISNWGSDNISVVKGATNTSLTSISLPGYIGVDPNGIAYDPLNSNIYVDAYTNADVLYQIDGTSNAIVRNATLNFAPDDPYITVDPVNGDLYVAGLQSVGVVNTASLTQVATIQTGALSLPGGTAYDPQNGYLYIANVFAGNLTVVNASTNSVVTSIPVGALPAAVVYDPVTAELYVANAGSGSISVISTSGTSPRNYPVAVSESGLPAKTEWWVNLTNGQSFHSTKTSISVSEPNGTYSYTTRAANKDFKGPSGKFTVYGKKVNVKVKFTDPDTSPIPGAETALFARWETS